MKRLPSMRSRVLYKTMFNRGSSIASRLILLAILIFFALPTIPAGGFAIAENAPTVAPSQESNAGLSVSSVKLGASPNSGSAEYTFLPNDWLVFDHFPQPINSWCDAEKSPPDDGPEWDSGVLGAEDDLLCWAAAASNVLQWTGWGYVIDQGIPYTDSDDMFREFKKHWTDRGATADAAWAWWIDGTVRSAIGASIREDGGGNFWPNYDPDGWIFIEKRDAGVDMAQALDRYLEMGYGVTLTIRKESDPDSSHVITCWGFRFDPQYDPQANPELFYKGIWVTDSDDDKNDPNPPDMLQYYDLIYDGWWHLHDYPLYSGSDDDYIDKVEALQPFPNTPPTVLIGGPYSGDEGSTISFDASGSWDLNSNPLLFRWDYENDGTWDTPWMIFHHGHHIYPDNGTYYAKLAVSDRMAVSYSTVAVTVNNVAPTLTQYFEPQAVNEGSLVTFDVGAADPGTDDLTFTLEISGQVQIKEFPYYLNHGSGTFSFPYTPDDSGIYTVNLTIADEDGGTSHYSTTLFVDNVNPIITPFGPFTVEEGSTVPLEATVWDLGSDDLEFKWEFEDGPTITHTHYNNGSSPDPFECLWAGDFPFMAIDDVVQPYGDNGVYTVTLTVADDDGGTATYSTTVSVSNVTPTIQSSLMSQPNTHFILPIVHTLTLSVSANDPGSDDLRFVWNWGDGNLYAYTCYNNRISPDPLRSPNKNPMAATATAQHIYANPGDYVVTLTVTDDDSITASTTMPVHVASAAEANSIIDQYVQSLPNTAFKAKADVAKSCFCSLFKAVNTTLVHKQYNGAIQILYSIRAKTDGYQGWFIKDDWVTDRTSQRDICHMIDDLIAYLQNLGCKGQIHRNC